MSIKFLKKINLFAIVFVIIALLIFGFYLINMNNSEQSTVIINTQKGSIKFYVEIAKTKEEREKGLMDRKSLEKDAGMLFIFEKSSPVNFWMKNTLIPLDMIFIDENLEIAHIEYNATPCPKDTINCPLYSSIMPIKYVLEIGAGIVKSSSIEEGFSVEINYITASK